MVSPKILFQNGISNLYTKNQPTLKFVTQPFVQPLNCGLCIVYYTNPNSLHFCTKSNNVFFINIFIFL